MRLTLLSRPAPEKVLTALATDLAARDRFLLLIHRNPDGDAVASSLTLALGLRGLGKSADVVCVDAVPEQFRFLPGAGGIKRDFLIGDYDVLVTLDCGDAKRTGFRLRLKQLARSKKMVLVNIDHHAKNDLHSIADFNYVDPSAPATALLVYRLLKALGATIDYRGATCLLAGLYTDTGGFKHANTTAESLQFAAELLALGGRLKDVTRHIKQATSVARLKLWGIALSRVRQHPIFNLVSTRISQSDIERVGAAADDVAGIASLLATIPADLAVLVVELPDATHVRLRTKNRRIDLAPLAAYLGGGGRKSAAGFVVR